MSPGLCHSSGVLMQPPRKPDRRVARARDLRRAMTEAEKKLWWQLRQLPLANSHFRRQAAIGPYFADFASHKCRVAIEVDGGGHGQTRQAAFDRTRSAYLKSRGYRVLRFWNNDLTANMDGVLEAIYAAIYGSSTAEPVHLKHRRRKRDTGANPKVTPPRRALRADPPPAGEGDGKRQS